MSSRSFDGGSLNAETIFCAGVAEGFSVERKNLAIFRGEKFLGADQANRVLETSADVTYRRKTNLQPSSDVSFNYDIDVRRKELSQLSQHRYVRGGKI